MDFLNYIASDIKMVLFCMEVWKNFVNQCHYIEVGILAVITGSITYSYDGFAC